MEESGFIWAFRQLVRSFRLSPECSERQLEAILRRVREGGDRPGPSGQTRTLYTNQTGGVLHEG